MLKKIVACEFYFYMLILGTDENRNKSRGTVVNDDILLKILKNESLLLLCQIINQHGGK